MTRTAAFFSAASQSTFLFQSIIETHSTRFLLTRFAALAGAFSGLLAFAIGKMGGVGGYSAWRWIFILEGAATVAAGFLGYFAIVDTPDSCKSLTPEEAEWIKWRKFSDAGAVGEAEEVTGEYFCLSSSRWFAIRMQKPKIVKTDDFNFL